MLRITKAIYLEINQNCITCRKIIEYLIGLIEMMTYYFSSCLSYFLFIFYRTEIKVLKHILLTGFNCSFLWILHFTLFVPPPPPPPYWNYQNGHAVLWVAELGPSSWGMGATGLLRARMLLATEAFHGWGIWMSDLKVQGSVPRP